jgi:hypothetical protein
VLSSFVVSSCDSESFPDQADSSGGAAQSGDMRADIERVLDVAVTNISQLADSVDDLLQPVPLLTVAEESSLRRYGNEVHLARARALGARPADTTELAELRAAGRLVELEDSTPLWAVRELDHSMPLVTPDTRALLTRIARQFQERLVEMGLPRYRVEVTSVLRTAESQADLRQSNPNAAAGASTHEFGTTLDIAYSSFAAPADPELDIDVSPAPWLESRIDLFAHALLESAAARKSRELQAILGKVLLELQQSGDVLVTLERQQPVFHITIGRAAR